MSVSDFKQHKLIKADLELAPHYRELAEIELALYEKLTEIKNLEIKLIGLQGCANRVAERKARKLEW